MNSFTQLIGTRIRTARKNQKISQVDLGDKTGLDQSYISRLENASAEGTPSQLYDIAKALGISMIEIIGEPPKKRPKRGKQTSSAGEVRANENLSAGLRELAADENLAKVIAITNSEWHTLSSIDLPSPVSKDAYVQLLITIRAAVTSGTVTKM